jgi:hypothetical protein
LKRAHEAVRKYEWDKGSKVVRGLISCGGGLGEVGRSMLTGAAVLLLTGQIRVCAGAGAAPALGQVPPGLCGQCLLRVVDAPR